MLYSFIFFGGGGGGLRDVVRVVLGTGRLTIARAIGQFFFWGGGGGGEDELRKFSEGKKKKRILSGLEPMPIPLTVQCNYH